MSATEFVAMLRRRALLITAVVATVVVAVGVWSLASPTIYQARATLFVAVSLVQIGTAEGSDAGRSQQPEPTGVQFIQPNIHDVDDARIDSYAELAERNRVLRDASERLDSGLAAEARAGKVTVSHPPASELIDVTARDTDPARAAAIANAVGRSLSDFVERLEQPVGGGDSPIKLELAQPALEPGEPASPKIRRNLAFALVGGLVLGLAAALVREMFDSRLRDPATVRDLLDLPVLATIDFDRQLRGRSLLLSQRDLDQEEIAQDRLADLWSRSRVAEEFRQLRVGLQYFSFEDGRRSVQVTSSRPGEGKTTTAGNLAITMALAGENVCLVDCDLRNPTVHRNLEIKQDKGVTDILIGRTDLDSALVKGRRLSVLTAGAIPPNPTELLGSQAMADLLSELHRRFGMVVIDTPPSLLFADPAVLAPLCGATLLVVRINHTDADDLERAATTLRGVDARLRGTVVNMMRSRGSTGSYYSYYYADRGDSSKRLTGSGFADLVPRDTNGHVAGAPPEVERRSA